MSFAKNGSSSHVPSFSRALALKVDVKTKNGAPYCVPVRLRLKGLELCAYVRPRREGYAREDGGSYYTVYGRVYVHPRQRGGVTEGRKIHLATSFIFIP